jgi:hypothetical protein
MYEFGTNTFIVATRANHACEWCGETICTGHNAMKRDYRFDGEWIHEWMHPICYHAMNDASIHVSIHHRIVQPDEFEPGIYYKGSTVRRDG